MVSKEIATSLKEQSASALLSVSHAKFDVVWLRDDAASLRSVTAGILQKLKKVHFLTFCLLYIIIIFPPRAKMLSRSSLESMFASSSSSSSVSNPQGVEAQLSVTEKQTLRTLICPSHPSLNFLCNSWFCLGFEFLNFVWILNFWIYFYFYYNFFEVIKIIL